MTLLETLDQAKQSLFRFEYLQSFSVNSEKELWDIWEKEHRIADGYMQHWWNYITDKQNSGVKMTRVSLVRFPLTPYKEMELEIFKKTITYGDDIRIITGERFDKLNLNVKDFWLIDESTAIDLIYTASGDWIGFSGINDTSGYLKAQQQILLNSVTLAEFLEKF
jgi:hypothetical protein